MPKNKESEVNTEIEKSEKLDEKIQHKKFLNSKYFLLIITLPVIFTLSILGVKGANPNSQPLYNIKRLYEKNQLNSKSSIYDKLNYLYGLLDKRLAELEFIVKEGKSSYVLTTSLRYSTTAGQITELIIQNNLKNESQKAKEKLESHFLIVKDLPQKYPKTDEEVKYIIDDANYLKIYINQLSSL
jgi:hypothetical protein